MRQLYVIQKRIMHSRAIKIPFHMAIRLIKAWKCHQFRVVTLNTNSLDMWDRDREKCRRWKNIKGKRTSKMFSSLSFRMSHSLFGTYVQTIFSYRLVFEKLRCRSRNVGYRVSRFMSMFVLSYFRRGMYCKMKITNLLF